MTQDFQYLFQVVRTFSEYPVASLDIVIVTNVVDKDKLYRITSLCSPLLEPHPARSSGKKTLSIESFPDLSDPWHLPWCHKHLISGRFLDEKAAYSHYIHVEDDIIVPFDNFQYFVRYRNSLQVFRLIPSFLRIEFNSNDNRLYIVDQIGVSDLMSRKVVNVDSYSFVNPDYPHNAMFILDRDLALEYINTRSFDRDRSIEVRPQWGLCERASMGLCFEDLPEEFSSRYVIPINPHTLAPPCWSWVFHISSNYTKNSRSPFGKTQPNQLFGGDGTAVKWSPPSGLDNAVWHLRRLAKRLWHGPPRSTGHDLVPRGLCPLCGSKRQQAGHCGKPNCPTWPADLVRRSRAE